MICHTELIENDKIFDQNVCFSQPLAWYGDKNEYSMQGLLKGMKLWRSPLELDDRNVDDVVMTLQHTWFPRHDEFEISVPGWHRLANGRKRHIWLDGHSDTCGVLGTICLATTVVSSIFV